MILPACMYVCEDTAAAVVTEKNVVDTAAAAVRYCRSNRKERRGDCRSVAAP